MRRFGQRLLKECACGNECACNLAKKVYALYAGSVISFSKAAQVKDHDNKLPFDGILLVCDEPSNKPPHGSEGHRILVRSEVAKKLLPTLPGMAINYDTHDLNSHATRHKVGVITRAWMDGKNVCVAGYLWKKDFPEIDKDLRNRKDLGMSMELSSVWVDDEKSEVWDLSKFTFTGATILRKDAAAYRKTSLVAQSLAAAAKAAAEGEEGEKVMKKQKKDKVAAASRQDSGNMALVTQAITTSLTSGLREFGTNLVNEIKASNERVLEGMDELRNLHLIQAASDSDNDDDEEIILHAKGKDEDDEDDDDDDMAAKGKDEDEDDDDDDDDDMEADAQDDESDSSSSDASASEVDAMEDLEIDPADEEPGEVNKDSKNKGRKTKVTKPPHQGEYMPGNVAKGRLHSSARNERTSNRVVEAAALQLQATTKQNKQLKKALVTMKAAAEKKIGKLHTRIGTMEAQLETFAEKEDRRSAPSRDLVVLAGKAGYNLGEIKAAGQKFTNEAVDHIFAKATESGMVLPVVKRIELKNKFIQDGLMEDDYVTQGGR
jgi:hypothetical protein